MPPTFYWVLHLKKKSANTFGNTMQRHMGLNITRVHNNLIY